MAPDPGRSGTARPTVLVLATTYPRWRNDHEPGFVHELSRRLAHRFNVIVVTPDAPGADPSGDLDGVHVLRYRYAPRKLQTLVNDGGIATNLRRSAWKWLLVPTFVLGQYLAARRALRDGQVDIMHAHWLISPGVIARLLSRPSLPYVVTSHGGDLFGFRQPLLTRAKRWVAAGATAFTVVSDAMVGEVRRLGLPAKQLVTIPMGVDLVDRFTPDGTIRMRSELLFVGRLVPKKGLSHLLDAMPRILAARPDVTLRIVGFGPERESLEAQAQRLGIAQHVVFGGAMAQADLPALYRRASVFVAPFIRDDSGDQEGLPVALMEAVATGCPFVVGDVAGLDDLLGGSSQYRVDPRHPDALADAVLQRLADPEAAHTDAMVVRQRVLRHIDWDVIAGRYADLLSDCIMEKGS